MVNILRRIKIILVGLTAFLLYALLMANAFAKKEFLHRLQPILYISLDSNIMELNSLADTANVYGHGTN